MWSRPIEESLDEHFFRYPGLADNQYIVFDLADYADTLGNLTNPNKSVSILTDNPERPRQFSRDLIYPADADPRVSLPLLTASELRSLIRDDLPSDDLPLYRIPENPDDRRGIKLLRRIKEALQTDDPTLTAVNPPANWTVVEIGLDLAQSAECIWYVGKLSSNYAILFVKRPHFPLWLSGSALDKVLSAEFD